MKNKYHTTCTYCKKIMKPGEGIMMPVSFRDNRKRSEFYHDSCYKLLTTQTTRFY